MKSKKSAKPKPVLLIDIAIPENILLPNGTLFVKLPTLDGLDKFWAENSSRFMYAATGDGFATNFLNEYEWVFGNTKAAVVETFCRWDEMGITAKFYDWAKEDPRDHTEWFTDRDLEAKIRSEDGKEPVPPSFYTTCTPETYRGWWKLHNLPAEFDVNSWSSDDYGFMEIHDWTLPVSTVVAMLQEQMFDDSGRCEYTQCFDKKALREYIDYWKDERSRGYETYGDPYERLTYSAQLNLRAEVKK